tara:strand:- start:1591 stop:2661 length:1071 start_codon:yes stop_codon:yes gene_type:complete
MARLDTLTLFNDSKKTTKKKKASKGVGSVLRYPYDIISSSTDYFQIDVLDYIPTASGGTGSFMANKSQLVQDQGTLADISKLKTETVSDWKVPSMFGGTLDKGSVKQLSDAYTNTKSTKTIILPIPTDIQDSNGTKWGEDELNDFAAWGMSKIGQVIEGKNLKEAGKVAADTVGELSSTATGARGGQLINYFKTAAVVTAANALGANTSIDGVLARSSGKIINKNVELLFSGVQLRTFSFSFDISPRDETEAEYVRQIIREFKIRSAPKMKKGQIGFLNSPDVFRIAYKKGKQAHPFLNSFKTCALQQMNVNYSASGTYATYHNGVPVHMKLDLTFMELNPIYAEDYDDKPKGVGY